MENQLAHAITQTEYDLSYDKAAKKLLANKQILAQIMKNCVNEYSACSVDEIAEKYIEGTPEVGTVGVHVDDTNRPKRTSDVIAGSNNEDSTLTEGTIKKHGISFKSAARIFFDYDRIEFYDEDHSYDEDRYNTIGDTSAGRISQKAEGALIGNIDQFIGKVNEILFVVYPHNVKTEKYIVLCMNEKSGYTE